MANARLVYIAGVVAAVLVHATVAHADGALDMAWADCVGDAAPVRNLASACGSNTGSQTLVCSLVAPTGIGHFGGIEIFIDLISQATPLPAWWGFYNAGACRQTSLAINTSYAGGGVGCSNPWMAAPALGAIAGYGSTGAPLPTIQAGNRSQYATIDAALAVAPGSEFPLTPGVQYFLANVTIDNAGTTGVGACAGCLSPVCISFTRALITQPGQPDFYLSTPGVNSLVTWQGNGADCAVVPVRRSTWGAIKATYR